MSNILIVGQKELVTNPIFKQDKNMLDVYNVLKDEHKIKILFVHKNIKLDKQNDNSEEQTNNLENNDICNVQQFCIRDMMKSGLLEKNINEFIKDNSIETIIFMSDYMAKLIMPYIENLLDNLNIICDFRLTNISYCLQRYKYEQEKIDANFNNIYKIFKMYFIQSLSLLKHTDYIVLNSDDDTSLLINQNINNIIFPEQISNCIKSKKRNHNTNKKKYKVIDISINRNNYSSIERIEIQKNNDSTKYIISETKKYNLIDDINSIIVNNKVEYFCIHSNKIEMLPKTLDILLEYISFNDKLALSSPLVFYSRDRHSFKSQFYNQRFSNFSNWKEDNPLFFSECVVIKRKFFNRLGLFDNKFKTFDYALFDFILRLYQVKAYYCVMNDISVFKPMNISRQISLFKEDKRLLCKKWGESLFNMGI